MQENEKDKRLDKQLDFIREIDKEKEIFLESLIKVSQTAFFMCFGKQICKNVL